MCRTEITPANVSAGAAGLCLPWEAVPEPGEVIPGAITAQTTCSATKDSDPKGTLGPGGFAILSANIWGLNARGAVALREAWLSSQGGSGGCWFADGFVWVITQIMLCSECTLRP